MYSKNDYRYYLENQLAHSDDYLAHYEEEQRRKREEFIRSLRKK